MVVVSVSGHNPRWVEFTREAGCNVEKLWKLVERDREKRLAASLPRSAGQVKAEPRAQRLGRP